MAYPKRPIKERLLSKITVDDSTGCWNWNKGKDKNGYGQIAYPEAGEYRAHRVSYLVFVGKIPAGSFVCHRCDNPSCINPSHLWLGTNDDNMADMVEKRRSARRESNPASKLKEADVSEIKRLIAKGGSNRAIAADFGVTHRIVSLIRRGLLWSDAQPEERSQSNGTL